MTSHRKFLNYHDCLNLVKYAKTWLHYTILDFSMYYEFMNIKQICDKLDFENVAF